MMVNKIMVRPFYTGTFLLFSIFSFAQTTPVVSKTIFNKFIDKPAVEWAAYANDTIRFTNNEWTDLLTERLLARKIKAAFPLESGSIDENKLVFLTKNSVDSAFAPVPKSIAQFDSIGLRVADKIITENNPIISDIKTHPAFVYQILFVKKGKLYSYISRISPRYEVITESGRDLGAAEFLSFAINKNYNRTSSKKDKLIDLGQTSKIFAVDSFPAHDQLKKVYGKNLLETIWPSFTKRNDIKIYSTFNNQLITNEQFIKGDVPGVEHVNVPIYDSLGNLEGTRILYSPLIPYQFTKIGLVQQWHYDVTKDIMICEIKEMLLYKKENITGAEFQEPVASYRIVF